ncbi:MAG: hypothetical protein ABIH65_03845 [Nanoarchaeota archaeon]
MPREILPLDIGGSLGSIKGGFYEKHFRLILENIGYKVINVKTFKEYKKKNKDLRNIAVHRYRTAPDEFTEVDFFIPSKKIGFWITNLGQIKRFKEKRSNSRDFNEFKDLKGMCPHCKKGNLPSISHKDLLLKWRCPECNLLVNPFDLLEKKSIRDKGIEGYSNKSASTQAHKQAYYRVGEYIEARTSEDNMSCVEIIYNHRKDWRNWHNVIDLFFDSSIFIFDDIKNLMGSESFEKTLQEKVKALISNPPQPDELIRPIIDSAKIIRERKNKNYLSWINQIKKSRISKWGKDEPVSFPIRYSIYGILKSNQTKENRIDPYKYGILMKIKDNKLNRNGLNHRDKKILLELKKEGFIDSESKKVMEQGESYMRFCKEAYLKFLKNLSNWNIKYDNAKDYWYNNYKDKIIFVLKDIYEQSVKNNWYKFLMIPRYDYHELNSTPFINEQFEPLETLTFCYLNQLKKEGIIKDITGESGVDTYEKTWLSDMSFSKNRRDFFLGTDASITLPNNKEVFIQCKSNTSFKNWNKDKTKIKNSGIPYKDSKRMIAHNFMSSFELQNGKLKFDHDRIYVGILDGNWNANKNNIYRTIKLMYLLGADEIFFADEFETRIKEYFKAKS